MLKELHHLIVPAALLGQRRMGENFKLKCMKTKWESGLRAKRARYKSVHQLWPPEAIR